MTAAWLLAIALAGGGTGLPEPGSRVQITPVHEGILDPIEQGQECTVARWIGEREYPKATVDLECQEHPRHIPFAITSDVPPWRCIARGWGYPRAISSTLITLSAERCKRVQP